MNIVANKTAIGMKGIGVRMWKEWVLWFTETRFAEHVSLLLSQTDPAVNHGHLILWLRVR